MKNLVILGLGARSTLFYQQKLHEMYFKLKGDYSTFPFIVKQLDFNLINPHLPSNLEVVSPILERELKEYNVTGVHLLVPNITIHEMLDTIAFNLQIIHPYKLLVSTLANRQTKKVVFFGTKFTNHNSYIDSYVKNNSIHKLQIEDLLFLDDLRKKVYAYVETNQEILIFNNLIGKYSKNHIVVIACTELSIINRSNDENVIDLSKLQYKECLKLITT